MFNFGMLILAIGVFVILLAMFSGVITEPIYNKVTTFFEKAERKLEELIGE